jgi:hypothetical protein
MQELIFGGAAGLGIAHLRNMANVADPSVTRLDDGYWMVLGALDPTTHVIDLFSAESGRATDGWRIVTEPGDPGLALRIADRPEAGGWDATGYHCPCHVAGADLDGEPVERIYYASSATWSFYGPYQIGFLEWDGQTWRRYPEPVFSASRAWELGTVLEPQVRYANGRWLMHYTAGIGADAPRATTALVASMDGIGDWQPIGAPEPDRFDTVTLGAREIVARHPLDGAFTRNDGLWLFGQHKPWQILRTTDGTDWHALGAWKPTALVADNELVVFYTAMGRSSAGPVPLFGIGCAAVSLEGLT